MAPPVTASQPMYQKDEKALCFHGELLYEAKVLEVRRQDSKDKTSPYEYRVHYKGWKNTWDDWVPQDRLRKLTDDNRELAANLKRELTQPPPRSAAKPTASNKHRKGQGSDLGSGRGSEERHSSVPAGGRGTRRGKDNDIEKVGPIPSSPTPRRSTRLSGAYARPGTNALPGTYPQRGSRLEPFEFSKRPRSPSGKRGNLSKTKTQPSRGRSLRRAISFSKLDPDGRNPSPASASVADILAQSPPRDEPEYISKDTLHRSEQLFWAPLIGGTTMEEKNFIKEEQASEGKIVIPERYHPKYIETRQDDPGNLNKMLFFEGQNPKQKLSIAGVPKEPLHLDPPGSISPFDALKYPEQLVDLLNRPGFLPSRGWDVAALNKIPPNLIALLNPDGVASLPLEVLQSKRLSSIEKVQQALTLRSTVPKCDNCITFRIKCNGQRPSCFGCRHAGERCSFDNTEDTVSPEPNSSSADDESSTKPSSFGTESTYLGLDLRDINTQYHLERSDTAHLNPTSAATSGPPKYDPKPTWTNLPNVSKRCRPRKAKDYAKIPGLENTTKGEESPKAGSSVNPKAVPNAYQDSRAQEENFHLRPSVRISIPDHLKNLLVDDWENVTKSLLLVPLPSKAPANFILDTYFEEEKGSRRLGSPEADVLEEFCSGMKVYFEKSVGKILLYRFERGQLAEIRHLWESGKYPQWQQKGPGDAYGAEHLARMLVNMPEIIAQTNMDTQAVARLREEITKFAQYLARNSGRFFCAKYEKPSAEYIENAR